MNVVGTVNRGLRALAAPAKTSLVVGTVLSLVNHTFTDGSPARIAMNYLVPFLVSSYSRYSLLRELESAGVPRREVE